MGEAEERSNQVDAIMCRVEQCLNLTKAGFQFYLQRPHIGWSCAHCFLPSCSDSFFELTDLSGINEELNADFECICVFSC